MSANELCAHENTAAFWFLTNLNTTTKKINTLRSTNQVYTKTETSHTHNNNK